MLSGIYDRIKNCNDKDGVFVDELDDYVDGEFFFLCLLDILFFYFGNFG